MKWNRHYEESSARVEVVFFKSVNDALDAGVVGASDNRHLQIIHFDDDFFHGARDDRQLRQHILNILTMMTVP